ncbi:hypothetical protein [Pseudomonas sp. L13]|uniref:hypothetical protein n=1 Tax=Pseudomonas sp. L13 TaxID=343985 RepID=UPI00137AB4D0|nr:hypothetical protein [Pseudomonas sp. L13]
MKAHLFGPKQAQGGLVSRQDLHKSLAKAGLLRFWGLGVLIIKKMLFVAFIPFKDEPPFV